MSGVGVQGCPVLPVTSAPCWGSRRSRVSGANPKDTEGALDGRDPQQIIGGREDGAGEQMQGQKTGR